jgi:methylated-DNA-protein-cysteine methyltransferase-like protein
MKKCTVLVEENCLLDAGEIPLYERIYYVVSLIPRGKVATYGQIARIVGTCTARMVGYAMSSLQSGRNVPWQRVINSKGEVSQHGDGIGSTLQRHLLVDEGVDFDGRGKVDFDQFGWEGPHWNWEETLQAEWKGLQP